jgi:hypothetical protein
MLCHKAYHMQALPCMPLCLLVLASSLQVFTNTAAALPCELAPDDEAAAASAAARKSSSRPLLDWLPASKYQVAWAQRVMGAKQQQQQEGPASGTTA